MSRKYLDRNKVPLALGQQVMMLREGHLGEVREFVSDNPPDHPDLVCVVGLFGSAFVATKDLEAVEISAVGDTPKVVMPLIIDDTEKPEATDEHLIDELTEEEETVSNPVNPVSKKKRRSKKKVSANR